MNKMEREKSTKLVITFATTSAAMAMDSCCPARLGRIIPVPQQISAGCGFAWCCELLLRDEVIAFMLENAIEYQSLVDVEMY